VTALCFEVPGVPQPMQRPRLGANGNVYTPRKTLGFEHAVATHALSKMRAAVWSVRGTGRYAIAIRAFFPDARRLDLDNVVKSALDGCTPLVWADDSQVDELHAWRGVDAKRPRVEIEIRKIDETASTAKSDRDARKTTTIATFTSEQFDRSPPMVMRKADEDGSVIITDGDGKPRMRISVPGERELVLDDPTGPSRARVQPTTEGAKS